VRTGDLITLDIEKPAAGGRMIARADGQVVLVAGAIPGERAKVRIDRIGKGVAYGAAVEIEQPSPERRVPFCDPECGGTWYAHIRYGHQPSLKAAIIGDAFARIAKRPDLPPVPVAASPEFGYRMRARLHARAGGLGFFHEGSHTICDARSTRQLLPATCDALDRVMAAIGTRDRERVEIEVSENVDASERAVHIELDGSPSLRGSLDAVAGVTGITASGRNGKLHLLTGDPHVTDTLAVHGARVTLRRHVLAFFQGNRFLLESLVAHVVEQIAPLSGPLVDLYAGVGLFSVAAASVRGVAVYAVEGDAAAANDLRANAAQCGGLVRAIHAPVEEFRFERAHPPSTVRVDPPRPGMSKVALQRAVALGAPRLVYVSCDVATLARDARVLGDAGYALQRLDGFDLFPNTPHVETVAVFDRRA
jgi:23S rRNA (uracil1939-C5)-methyltransferase